MRRTGDFGLSQCPACAAAVEDGSRFCRACGASLCDDARTTPLPATTPLSPSPASRTHPSNDPGAERFLPGTLLHGRYRIVALLGRGGMGEVYRADDTKLGQPVALKFLPEALAHDADALQRFYAEVRIGRQVSHPNVCRMYDVVEIDGHPCLTMEFIDGEDLASLIRRIGRLPADKAIEFAREVAAGLAAMHERGVIHRDLKPANILIDGQGRARITDFGIAALVDDADNAGFAGTLVYMAPEQLDGAPPSVRTDLYALGLVLYEALCGKRLFNVGTPGELKSLHRRSEPPSLTSAVRDVPPAVERLVRACLAHDPSARPATARAVLAALPGGDPLQAALDAGETPTPEMVAAAGRTGALSRTTAWSLLLAAFAGLVLLAGLSADTTVIGRLHPGVSPDRLAERAEQVVAAMGYPSPARESKSLFAFDRDFLRAGSGSANKDPVQRWSRIAKAQPGPLLYVQRGSEQPIVAQRYAQMQLLPNEVGRVTASDPPLNVPGMTRVTLDRNGRLVEFVGLPSGHDEGGSVPVVDWRRALEFSGIASASLRPVAPAWNAPVDSDTKRAWQGSYAGQPDTVFRIEAASYRGQPVWFAVLAPWYQGRAPDTQADVRFALWVLLAVGVLMLLALVVMAARNLRRARSDVRGAFRLAFVMYAALTLGLLLRADHPPAIAAEIALLMNVFAQSTYFAAIAWLIYVAFEPFARRQWPLLMVGWSRLMAGRWRDAMVGRDVLCGAIGGIAMVLVVHLATRVPSFPGHERQPPIALTLTTLASDRHVLFIFLMNVFDAFLFGIVGLALLFLFRRLLRWPALAHAVSFAVLGLGITAGLIVPWSVEGLLFTAILYGLMIRFGVLAAGVAYYVMQILLSMPLTLDPQSWYAERTVIAEGAIALLLAGAFWTSLAGKPPLSLGLFDEGNGR